MEGAGIPEGIFGIPSMAWLPPGNLENGITPMGNLDPNFNFRGVRRFGVTWFHWGFAKKKISKMDF